jgi:membrane protein DedA with SNARE-associated domain
MAFESLTESIIGFLREHQTLAEPVVFALGFAEGIPVVSLFVPSSALFLAIGSAQGAIGGGILGLWSSAAAGAMLGDCVTYAIGRCFKQQAQRMLSVSRHPERIAKAYALLERWGGLAVFVGKFLGLMRPIIPMLAGMLRMPLVLFLALNAVSSMIWAAAFLMPGWGLVAFFGTGS